MRSNSGCQSCGVCASRRDQQGCIEPWELLHALCVSGRQTLMGAMRRKGKNGCSDVPSLASAAVWPGKANSRWSAWELWYMGNGVKASCGARLVLLCCLPWSCGCPLVKGTLGKLFPVYPHCCRAQVLPVDVPPSACVSSVAGVPHTSSHTHVPAISDSSALLLN